MAKLIIQTGKLAGKQLIVPMKEVLIGRDEGCYIRMGSPDISRKHCTLRATSDGILVEDLGSSNGTYINDIRIDGPTILKGGDKLRVGPAIFEVDGPKPILPKIDDDIVDWLNDGDSKTGLASDEDTAIHKLPVKGDAGKSDSANSDTSKSDLAKTAIPAPHNSHKSKRVFKTVAEEAQYVIALYHEQQLARARDGH